MDRAVLGTCSVLQVMLFRRGPMCPHFSSMCQSLLRGTEEEGTSAAWYRDEGCVHREGWRKEQVPEVSRKQHTVVTME